MVKKRHSHIPKLRVNKHVNQAFVEVDKHRIYLGNPDLPETQQAYHRFVAEYMNNGYRMRPSQQEVTVYEVTTAFVEHAEKYYRKPNGTPTSEPKNYNPVLTLLTSLYGNLPAKEFGPRELETVRDAMVKKGWSRKYVNNQTGRIRRVFKRAARWGMVPLETHQKLMLVEGLQKGRCEAPDYSPVRSVHAEHVKNTLPFLSGVVADMVLVQLRTGMRPGEICQMRPIDLDTKTLKDDKVWLYQPQRRKTEHVDHLPPIPIGPAAQEILGPYLLNRSLRDYIFRPTEAVEQIMEARHERRTTPLSCGNRPGTNRKRNPQTKPGDHYTPVTYARAIRRACEQAFPFPKQEKLKYKKLTKKQRAKMEAEMKEWNDLHRWTPNQLRHTRATAIASECDAETARVILGHSSIETTRKFYIDPDLKKAAKVVRQSG